ncbi:MAG: hypothetical protein KJN90_10110 [Gammaproteobacteria bacterium]|nr:hypothetical protein [Gammaproteobacteria bacterium]
MCKAVWLSICLMFPLATFAQIKTGDVLVEEWQAYEKVAAGNALEPDLAPAEKFQSYVIGVYDTLRVAERVCPPNNVSQMQIFAVVGNYVRSDPTRWSLPAIRLVQRPILNAWPCNR